MKFVDVDEKALESSLKKLVEAGVYRIISISGCDNGKEIEVMYHFDISGKIVTLRMKTSRKNPKISSVTKYFPGAELFERELSEMFGVEVIAHPDMKNLFLSKDSPKTPLRK